jgi:hypothetical protein
MRTILFSRQAVCFVPGHVAHAISVLSCSRFRSRVRVTVRHQGRPKLEGNAGAVLKLLHGQCGVGFRNVSSVDGEPFVRFDFRAAKRPPALRWRHFEPE